MRPRAVLLAAALLAPAIGCSTPQGELDTAEANCAQQGIQWGTPAFTRCVQQQDDALSREAPPQQPAPAVVQPPGATGPTPVGSEPAPAPVPLSSMPF
ncbi:MAG TPA: hypothetical protein VE397_07725 [Stellaceae bacterium]|nr:hypothetical protein [Stellaceae bacterium]